MDSSINLGKIQKVYFIGIKGVAMSGLAMILKQMGKQVIGSDVAEEFITDINLKKAGIRVIEKFNPANLDCNPDLVVVAAAWDGEAEFLEAKKRKFKVIYEAELRALLFNQFYGIAVAGIHGKTTTSSILSYVMREVGLDPSFLIGTGRIFGLGSNAYLGKSKYFVLEADEYKVSDKRGESKFHLLSPKVAIVTNIEMDHPDFFKTGKDVMNAFVKFAGRISQKGLLVASADNRNMQTFIKKLKVPYETYGFINDKADWVIEDPKFYDDRSEFSLVYKRKNMGEFQTALSGQHNVENIAAVCVVLNFLGVDLNKVKRILPAFEGVERRFEVKGEAWGVLVIDDYGHHPTEISRTLAGARAKFENRKIWCVFQPHTFTRTKKLLSDFAKSFADVDHVIIADIWGSAREKAGDISSKDLANLSREHHADVKYIGDLKQIEAYLLKKLQKSDIVITMGAGDVYKMGEDLIKALRMRE